MSKASTVTKTIQEQEEEPVASIRLVSLSLENFKGVRRFSIEPHGKDVRVLGDNAAGKTTLADAFSWLLFGRDSLGRADFEIKTLDKDGSALHGLEHAVEAVLDIDNSGTVLRKAYREKWTKRRGSAEKEFSGHTRDHFINGVPVSQGEYEERIALLGSEKVFRLLTNPAEFAERIHWQERRRILLFDVAGDLKDADVIASSPDLADLSHILNGRSIDDHRKVAQAQRRKINEELQKLPVRIDEVSRNLPEAKVNPDKLQAELEELRAKRREAEAERSRIEAGGELAEKTKRLRELEGALLEEANKERAAGQLESERLRAELAEAQTTADEAARTISRLDRQAVEAMKEIRRLEERMAALREEWHEIDSGSLLIAQDEICPACGQELPQEQVEEARAKARAQFNSSKASRLAGVAAEGKELRARADKLTAEKDEASRQIAKAKKTEDLAKDPIARLLAEIARLIGMDRVRELSALEHEMLEEKRALQAEIEKLRENSAEATEAVSARIEALNAQIVGCETALSTAEQRRLGQERIEQLKRQERSLAGEFEELERQLYLLDEFTRRKVSMLTERINSRFELARFRLFNVLVNGGVEECCDVTYQGVPWSSLNTGAQVNIGLDVIRTLSEHYGISPPIFVDHAESVTTLLDTPGQQIRLEVSEHHKELHVKEA